MRDSILCVHRDEIQTHIISLIVHIDEYPDVKWPLDFIDHEGKHHEVTFDKQDMLMYESLCVHARQHPLLESITGTCTSIGAQLIGIPHHTTTTR